MVTTILTSLRPLFTISKCLGICPYSIKPLKPSYLGTFTSFLIVIGYGVFHLLGASISLAKPDDSNFVTVIINSFNRYSGISNMWVFIIMSVISQRTMVNALDIFLLIDEIFAGELNVVVNNFKFSVQITVQLIVYLVVTAVLEYCNCLMYLQERMPFDPLCVYMCVIPFMVTCTTMIQFIGFLNLIKNRLNLINKCLGDLLSNVSKLHTSMPTISMLNSDIRMPEKPVINEKMLELLKSSKNPSLYKEFYIISSKKVNPKVLSNNNKTDLAICLHLQTIYTNLEKVSLLIMNAYCVQVVVLLVIKFSILTSMLYYCSMVMIKNVLSSEESYSELISASGWVSMLIFEVFILSFMCYSTKCEARTIGYNLHKYALQINNSDCKQVIRAFSMQLLHNRIEFSPLGLFNLDLNFMYNLIGAVCTYLIILIQFDMAQAPKGK